MESLKNVYCEKMGLFRFFGGKNFFCGGARGRAALDCCGVLRGAALECADCCEAFRARVDGRDGLLRGAALECVDCLRGVPGRAWMEAMEVVHV